MDGKYKQYAPIGLVISGLALLSLVGFFLARVLIEIQLLALPDDELLTRGLWISAGAVVLGLAITALLNPDGVRRFFTGRQMRYGSNSIILLLAVIGVLFFANALVLNNPQTWDMTEDQQNTLNPETVAILESLDEPILARAYYSTQLSSDNARRLLENFRENSKGRFTYEFINPEFNPVMAERDNVERDGTIVLISETRREIVSFASERDLASGILRLMNPGERYVYFTAGHGELSIDTPGESSYTLVRRSLELKNYIIESLNLISAGSVPENADAVVIVGPQRPFSEAEVDALRRYLVQGGGLVVMKEPVFSDEEILPDPLDDLLAEWGIAFNNDLVIDPNVNPPIIAVADPASYANHPVTQGLLGYYSAFPTARSLSIVPIDASSIIAVPLAFTGANAWGETDLDSIGTNAQRFDPDVDTPGPVILAIASEDWLLNTRLVAFGDSELAADSFYRQGNGDIVINAIDWVAEQEQQINLTPRDTINRQYRQPGTLGLIGLLFAGLCALPIIIAGAGISTWVARRRRG
jgi:ABC-type uncharacterized transport system involved in gliding motility auxiliary subunit